MSIELLSCITTIYSVCCIPCTRTAGLLLPYTLKYFVNYRPILFANFIGLSFVITYFIMYRGVMVTGVVMGGILCNLCHITHEHDLACGHTLSLMLYSSPLLYNTAVIIAYKGSNEVRCISGHFVFWKVMYYVYVQSMFHRLLF